MSQSWSLGLSLRTLGSAIIESNGEVRWPMDVVAEAITELADAGMVIVGLDIWSDREGAPTEILFFAYSGGDAAADVEWARDIALAALPSIPDYGWEDPNLLVTWIPSTWGPEPCCRLRLRPTSVGERTYLPRSAPSIVTMLARWPGA